MVSGFRFQVSGVLLIEATDNPRPVHKLCHQTQHPKQDHHLESPRTRPESLPALSLSRHRKFQNPQHHREDPKHPEPHGLNRMFLFAAHAASRL